MKLWIDDVRQAPDGWTWAATSADAIHHIVMTHITGGSLDEISFDHDLGGDDTGYIVARMIEKAAVHGIYLGPCVWHVHSANPVGKANIIAAMKSAERFWGREE